MDLQSIRPKKLLCDVGMFRIFKLLMFFIVMLTFTGCPSSPTPPPAEKVRHCGTMIGYDDRLKTDPVFAANEKKLESQISNYIKRMKKGEFVEYRSGKIIIPVVVHVIYGNATENISDAQIQSQIDVLNEDYRKLNADVSGVPGDFTSDVADARIEFKLAQRDPDCNPTTGITRTSTTETSFDFDPDAATATARNPVKFDSSNGKDGWPSDKYLNFWVCDLSGTLMGYGSFPSDFATRPTEDGVVMDHEYFGNTGTAISPFDLGRTTTHEIGHWLNLKHIWGDDSGTCTGSDLVTDTPNQADKNFDCPTHPQNTCSSDDMFMNYMDYVDDDCMIMFTNGQSDRMDAVLYTTRVDIVGSQGDVPPPADATDLWSRDMADDEGVEPNIISAYMYKSDDIWIRNANDGLVNQEHQNPIGNATNYVYVRIRNKGCGIADSADVKLYWAKTGTGLSWPSPWDGSVIAPALMGEYIGSQASGNIAASDFTILTYTWNTPNPTDYASFGADRTHFCLLSRIETSAAAPYGMTTPETANLSDNVKNNNNIVWKNVSVSEPDAGGRHTSAIIANYSKQSNSYRIVFENMKDETAIFDYGLIYAVLNKRLFEIWKKGGMKGEGISVSEQSNKIQILKDGSYLDNIKLDPNQLFALDVLFQPNMKMIRYKRNVFKLEMKQNLSDSNKFVGGQTFVYRIDK